MTYQIVYRYIKNQHFRASVVCTAGNAPEMYDFAVECKHADELCQLIFKLWHAAVNWV